MPSPAATATTPVRPPEAGVALGHLLAHVGDVEVGHLADPVEDRDRGLGLVGVDVDLEGDVVADDEDRVAEPLQAGQVLAVAEAAAGDDEVGAVAVAAVLVVGQAAARRLVVGDLRHLGPVAAQPGDDAGEDQDEAVAAGVDDAGFAQHLELLGGAGDGALAVGDRPLEDLGEDRVLLLFGDVAAEPLLLLLEVGELAGERVGHLAEDGQHRPLGRLPDRVVGGVGGAGEGGGDEGRVDQLAGAAGELLGGAADDLAEDHPELPRAPISAARASAWTSSVRPTSSTSWPSRRSSSSITARIVIAMLSPVSPSATGKTLRSLTSWRRASRRRRQS